MAVAKFYACVMFQFPRPLKPKLWRKLKAPPGWKKRRVAQQNALWCRVETNDPRAGADISWAEQFDSTLLLIME